MADQLALGLKSSVKKLETTVKELKAAMTTKVSTKTINKLNSKVTLNLRKPA
jgi:glycine betaine/choline ABC-type transport system substrate-binding protein